MSNPATDAQAAKKEPKAHIPAPPPTAAKWVRRMLGFTVAVGIGLAPLLGNVGVPGFVPVLSLYPAQLQGVAIPLASFLMGVTAIAVDLGAGERLTQKLLRRAAVGSIASVLVVFMLLFATYFMAVVRVPVAGGAQQIAVVIGFEDRGARCAEACPPALSDIACIENITLSPAAIESCYGSRNVRKAEAVLVGLYCLMMATLGALVGVSVLRGDAR